MTTATKIQLPYLEDTGLDGKKIYTPENGPNDSGIM